MSADLVTIPEHILARIFKYANNINLHEIIIINPSQGFKSLNDYKDYTGKLIAPRGTQILYRRYHYVDIIFKKLVSYSEKLLEVIEHNNNIVKYSFRYDNTKVVIKNEILYIIDYIDFGGGWIFYNGLNDVYLNINTNQYQTDMLRHIVLNDESIIKFQTFIRSMCICYICHNPLDIIFSYENIHIIGAYKLNGICNKHNAYCTGRNKYVYIHNNCQKTSDINICIKSSKFYLLK
jgi:hypothetical protein